MGTDEAVPAVSVAAGMAVYLGDDWLVGAIDGVPGSRMQVAGRYLIPLSMIERVAGDRVYLTPEAVRYLATPALEPGEAWPAEQWRTGERSPGLE